LEAVRECKGHGRRAGELKKITIKDQDKHVFPFSTITVTRRKLFAWSAAVQNEAFVNFNSGQLQNILDPVEDPDEDPVEDL
jgi:hypothetical protein